MCFITGIAFAQNAGTDQDLCDTQSTILAADDPSPDTGTWSLISGPGTVNFTDNTLYNTAISVTSYGSYTLRWTLSGGSSDDVVIVFAQSPTPANAGTDQVDASMCDLTSTTLAGNTPTIGTGQWTIVSGTGGNLSVPGSPTSNFSGTAGETYVLRWTISNPPCTDSFDDVTITFQQSPTPANAGTDQVDALMCDLTSTTLAGNTPTIGTGQWTIVSGSGGNLSVPGSPTSNFSGTAGETYVLRWTISNPPCTDSFDDVTITFQQSPTPANAGTDQVDASMCDLTSTTLAGNTPTIGTGQWTIVSGTGGNLSVPGSPTSNFSGTAGETYVLRWTISNPPCTDSFDDVTITFQQSPTPANAGTDQVDASMCDLTSTTLAGNTPTIGTGQWTIVSRYRR